MGSGKREQLKGGRWIGWLAVAMVTLAVGPTPRLTHSFDIQAAGRLVCTDGAVYVGETTAASALNILQTSEVWDGTGPTLLATGNSHTFTAVGQTFTYIVPGAFTAGSTVTISVTNIPGTLGGGGGGEGDAATATVDRSCTIAGVPTLPVWGMVLLALALLGGGAVLLARGGRLPSARSVAS